MSELAALIETAIDPYEALSCKLSDDVAFARAIDQQNVPHWTLAWERIGRLQRQHLVRVIPLSRWTAKILATNAASESR